MEGKGEFSEAEFDLLGMLFPGDGLDDACTSLSMCLADGDRLFGGADFEVPANAGVSTPGDDEDCLPWSPVDVVDPVSPWNSGFCVPTADFSGILSRETIGNDMATSDSQVPTAHSIPVEDNVSVDKGSKHKTKSVTSEKSANSAMEIVETPKKRPRQYRVKRQERAKTRKNQSDNDNNGDCDDNVIGRQDGQSPASSCSSEVDLSSQQLSSSNDIKDDSSALNDTRAAEVKPRASRGAATNPQSLYARRRRERINERLRILQNLIPNGTKVDIRTMLEEAVHYVKFLQIQIKLLSSDELWMYAPIAYNGKDIGLNLNQFFPSQP